MLLTSEMLTSINEQRAARIRKAHEIMATVKRQRTPITASQAVEIDWAYSVLNGERTILIETTISNLLN